MAYRMTQIRYYGEEIENNFIQIPISNATEFNELRLRLQLYIVKEDKYEEVPREGDIYSSSTEYYIVKNYNNPPDVSKGGLISGEAFNKYPNIYKISIQTLPGIKFTLNDNPDWIMVGANGVYELDLSNMTGVITSIMFESSGIEAIANNSNAYLFIDLAYQQIDNFN